MGFRNTKEDKQNYEAFLAKFNDPNHEMTTDDCYTPEPAYNAIREWVFTNLNVPLDTYVVRPFYPNGDYVIDFLDRDDYRKDTFGGGIRVDDATAEKIIAIRAKRGIYERYREDDENS